MRIGLDATPLLGVRTGIGHYTARLAEGLTGGDDDVVATAITLRGAAALASAVPKGVRTRVRPFPARALREAWAHSELPPVEWLCGPVHVFHATNFVLPPLSRAAGVVTVHDLTYLHYPETVSRASLRYRDLVPRSLARAAVVCTPSRAVADEIAETYRLDPDEVVVTPLGVEPEWLTVRPPDDALRAELDLPPRYLLAVGTLEPRKNLPLLVRAYARLRAESPDTPPLLLVGAKGWGPELDLDGLPAGSVRPLGYVETAALRQVVAGAAVLAFPSTYEGFGLPPLEALGAGVPVVAADLPVTREVLGDAATLVPVTPVDGSDGLLSRSADPADAWAAALGAALATESSPADVDRRRAHAARWTWPRCVAATRAAYDTAFARTATPA